MNQARFFASPSISAENMTFDCQLSRGRAAGALLGSCGLAFEGCEIAERVQTVGVAKARLPLLQMAMLGHTGPAPNYSLPTTY
ncbi:hypothetical protein [Cupriavidus necator]|uniref:hypothetical protein n=1 Tax=Cupriavidus necator TaxID=106590 RepID=UPI00115FBC28|nr:hypothetical protein [Cupriavidus necator]